MKTKLLISFLMMVACLCAKASDYDSIFAQRLAIQRYVCPQEKIHVTTDKSAYLTGDTIWMRAFVVDAVSHEPVCVSKYVYVELRDPFGGEVARVKVMERDSVYSGYVALDQDVPEGNYTLVAYTLFMQNAGEAYFFKKSIEISSIHSSRYKIDFTPRWQTREGKRELAIKVDLKDREKGVSQSYNNLTYRLDDGKEHKKKVVGKGEVDILLKGRDCESRTILVSYNNYKKFFGLPRPSDEYELKFYPEGGYLVPNVANKVGVKALAENGYGCDVKGRIVDNSGKEVTTFATQFAGMCTVEITPEVGKTYTAFVKAADGEEKEVALPALRSGAAIVQIHRKGGKIIVRPAGDLPAEYHLVVQQRGRMLAYAQGEFDIDEATIPAGVVQVLLVNKDLRALSERLFFVRDHSASITTAKTRKAEYSTREKVVVDVKLDGFAMPEGNYAVSVTDDHSVGIDSVSEIERQLLLQSDLRGFIENPSYYFGAENHDAELDALLLTQGWRRYNVPLVLRGLMSEPTSPIERGYSKSGRLGTTFRNKAVADGAVQVISPRIKYFDQFPTDSAGVFEIKGCDFPEGTRLVVHGVNKKGKEQANISFDPEPERPQVFSFPMESFEPEREEQAADYVASEAKRMRMRDGGVMLMLDEVVVSAYNVKRPTDMFETMATRSIDYEKIEDRKYTRLEEIIRTFPGVNIIGGQVVSRGRRLAFFIDGIYYEPMVEVLEKPDEGPEQGGEMMKMIRGITSDAPIGMSTLDEIEGLCPLQIVKRVDFIPSTNGVALGPNASNGAIMIITKDGTEKVKEHPNVFYKILDVEGYQRPVEFYSPSYEHGDAGIGVGTDLRSTLVWKPCVKISPDGTSSFDFYASDNVNTTYTVTIEGVSPRGEIIKCKQKVHVGNTY